MLAIGILNYFMHHIAPFVEFDTISVQQDSYIVLSLLTSLLLYIRMHHGLTNSTCIITYLCKLSTCQISFLKNNNIVSNCILVSKNPEDLQHYSFVFVLIV